MRNLIQDLRYGLRMLSKNPGFTAVAVITLALGIGVNTTIFSFVSAILVRKPAVHDPDRVMMLLSRNPNSVWGADRYAVSAPDFIDWRAQSTSFSGIAAASFGQFTLSGGTEPERVSGALVSAGFFRVLGVGPLLGRAFMAGEDQPGREREVILSESLWESRFGRDPQVIRRTVKIDGDDYAVIGVVRSSLQYWFSRSQLWMPLAFTPEQLGPSARSDRSLEVYARLKPSASENRARAEMAAIAARIAATHPQTNKGWGANVLSLQEYSIRDANVETALVFLMATVGFVLLIACANLANLLLARNSGRQREFAIRAALGAGRLRLARQLFAECLLLSLAGGALGVVFAGWAVSLLRAQLNWNDFAVAMGREIFIDRPVLLFTLGVSVAAAMIFGLAPALQVSRSDLNAGLKESSRTATGGRGCRRLQSLLVVGELALSLILLAGAGLFVKSFIEEMQASLGVDPHNVLTASVSLKGGAYKDTLQRAAFFENVLRRLDGSPEVESAAVTSSLPLTFAPRKQFSVEGRASLAPHEETSVSHYVVSPKYFETVRIPFVEGRLFKLSDDASGPPVVVVNEAFVRKYFDGESPLGHRLKIGSANSAKWSEIVGVVEDVEEYTGQTPLRPQVFEPFLAHPEATMKLVVRTRTEPASFASSLRRAVWGVDNDQAVSNVRTMSRVVQDSGQGDDLMTEMMSAFAGIALAMAAVGIYGLLSYLVGQRTHEFGIRMALGAQRSEVLRMVMRNAMSLALAGTTVGFVASLGLPRLFAASFTGYHVHSAWILAGTPLAVILIALASCYVPARRATMVDPMVALRYE